MKKIFAFIIALVMTSGICAKAITYRYVPGFQCENVNERLLENIPEAFDIDKATKNEIFKEDFSGNKFNTPFLAEPRIKGSVSYECERIKFVKSDTETESYIISEYITDTKVEPGSLYAFYCDIVTENVTGSSPYNIITAYGNDGYLLEAGGTNKSEGYENAEWTNLQILPIPEKTEYLTITVYIPKETAGTVYFDNFKFYQVLANPLETVLSKPNYKGLIYGDGEADISLDVIVNTQNYYNIENLRLETELVDINDRVYKTAVLDAQESAVNFTFSSKGLAEGDYRLVTRLIDKTSENVISTRENTLRKRSKEYRPKVYLDEDGNIYNDGKRTFLKRIYYDGSDTDTLAKFRDFNIDTISGYSFWWLRDISDTSEEVDFLRENNMTHHACLFPYIFSLRSSDPAKIFINAPEDTYHLFTQVARDNKENPVLDGYYVYEEVNPFLLGDELRWANEIFSAEDIDHPTIGVANKFYDRYGLYVGLSDFIGIDPYPVEGKGSDDLSVVGKKVRQIKKSYPNRPVFLVLQGFRWKERGDVRGPNEAELKNMAWQAICEGAQGLDWYYYNSMITEGYETPEQWETKLKNVYTSIAPYENIILSDEPTPSYTVYGSGDWLNMTLRHLDGKTYLFAVNNTNETKSVSIDIDGIGRKNLSFAPYEVKQLSYQQSSVISSEAELKQVEFSNGKQSFAVAAGNQNNLFVNSDSGVINYSVNISEGASLYIDGKPMAKSGKITVRHATSFKITVLAADGKSKTEKKYEIIK